MKGLIVGCAAVAMLSIAACGKDSPSPTTPTPTPVTPSVQGSWSGRYTVTACRQTGDFYTIGFCSVVGSGSGPIQLTVTQNGNGVSGTLYLGSTSGSFSGVIDNNGKMQINAQIPGGYNVSVTNWTSQVSGSSMTGSFMEDWRYGGGPMTGIGQLDCTLTSMTRNASSMQAFAVAAPHALPQTLEQTAAAMVIR